MSGIDRHNSDSIPSAYLARDRDYNNRPGKWLRSFFAQSVQYTGIAEPDSAVEIELRIAISVCSPSKEWLDFVHESRSPGWAATLVLRTLENIRLPVR